MSLRDYDVARDHFRAEEITGLGMAFPCCCCAHRGGKDTAEPCRTCDHNAGVVPDKRAVPNPIWQNTERRRDRAH